MRVLLALVLLSPALAAAETGTPDTYVYVVDTYDTDLYETGVFAPIDTDSAALLADSADTDTDTDTDTDGGWGDSGADTDTDTDVVDTDTDDTDYYPYGGKTAAELANEAGGCACDQRGMAGLPTALLLLGLGLGMRRRDVR